MQIHKVAFEVSLVPVHAQVPKTWLPGSVSGACGPSSSSPRPPPFGPPTPRPIRWGCSPASQLLWRDLTSSARASSATAPRLPDADHPSMRVIELEISRIPYKEHPYMPGSRTTQGRSDTCANVPARVAFVVNGLARSPPGATCT